MAAKVLATRAVVCSGAPMPGPAGIWISSVHCGSRWAVLTLRVADTVQLFDIHATLLDGCSDDLECPFFVVLCGVARLEAFTRRSDVRMAYIRQYLDCPVWTVLDHACAKLVGAAFEAEGEHGLLRQFEGIPPGPDDATGHGGSECGYASISQGQSCSSATVMHLVSIIMSKCPIAFFDSQSFACR
jgi:hypothetical protein